MLGLGDGRGGVLAVPAVVPPVAPVAAAARVGNGRAATVVMPRAEVVAVRDARVALPELAVPHEPGERPEFVGRLGTFVDTFA